MYKLALTVITPLILSLLSVSSSAAQVLDRHLPDLTDDAPEHVVVMIGAGERGEYRIEASGRLEKRGGEIEGRSVSVNEGDTIDGGVATGWVGGGADAYAVFGEIETIEWTGGTRGEILVDGSAYRPGRLSTGSLADVAEAVQPDLGVSQAGDRLADEVLDAGSHLVIAGDRAGGEMRWAVARGSANWVGGVPQEMVDTLVDFTRDGTEVDVIAFAPNGGWTVVAGAKHFTRNVGGGYFDTLTRLQDNGREIMAVAFNPVNWENMQGYVIVHDQGVEHAHAPDDLVQRLNEFVSAGEDVYDVAMIDGADWSFVTSDGNWTRSIGSGFFQALSTSYDAGETAEAIAFFGAEQRWILATASRFEGAGVPDGLVDRLRGDFGLEGDVDPAQGDSQAARPADAIAGFRIATDIAPMTDRAGAGRVDVRREIDLVDRPIRYLSWKERGDRPCILGVSSLAPTMSRDEFERRGERQTWESGDCDYIGPGILSYNASGLNVSAADDEVVTGIRVCTNHSRRNARVKGFELIGWDAQSYYEAGENPADSATGDAHAARPNCSDWHHAACPSGHVATGLELTVRQAGGLRFNGRWVNGASLICRRLEPT